MADLPSSQRRTKSPMKPPEKGAKPKKITTKNPPGGSQTPGAKGTHKPKRKR